MRVNNISKSFNVQNVYITKQNLQTAKNDYKNQSDSVNLNHSNYSDMISFHGIYDPAIATQKAITRAFRSFDGPSYFPFPSIVEKLLVFIAKDTPLDEKTLQSLTRMKAHASNFQAFVAGKSLRSLETFKAETGSFIDELRQNIPLLKQTMKEVKLPEKESDFLLSFVAQTAPTLHAMGFSDAIGHSTQVARMCLLKAHSEGAQSSELLQAGLVGWLHDPKFSGHFENLATHPIVAGSIAREILSDNKNRPLLLSILRNDITRMKKFVKGAVEALSINNDSIWVNNNVINKKVASAVSESQALLSQRLEATSNTTEPIQFSADLRAKLKALRADTGIRLIDSRKLSRATSKMPYEGTVRDLFEHLLDGRITDPEALTAIRKNLEANKGIRNITVPADTLFCHHKEVKEAPLAARALIVADQKLLSPHKIIMAGFQETVFGRICSFCDSFNQNVNNMPIEDSLSAKKWQKELYKSMLETADELTGQNKLQEATQDLPLEEQIAAMNKLIQDEKTWGQYALIKPKDSPESVDLQQLVSIMSQKYNKAAEASKEMFAA